MEFERENYLQSVRFEEGVLYLESAHKSAAESLIFQATHGSLVTIFNAFSGSICLLTHQDLLMIRDAIDAELEKPDESQ